jgi:hypothetical protein
MRWELTKRCVCAEAPLALGLLLVAFVARPGLADPYTSVKWYVLQAVAAGWLLSERLLCEGRGLPSFVQRTRWGWLVLAAWVVGSSLRHGPTWAMAPLLARASFVALALASYWSFRRRGLRLGALRSCVALAEAVVVTLGLLQMADLRPLPWLTGGDQRSATFGNVNMAAQFVGLALVVLFSRSSDAGGGSGRRLLVRTLGFAGLGYVVLAGTRSVALALVAASLVLALLRRSREAFARGCVALVAAAMVVLPPLVPSAAGPGSVETPHSKATSAGWRLAVWSDTLDLVRDHPLGVGAGNFEHAFAPYALAGRSRPGEQIVFRSPHNDYLRLLAEEGGPGALLLLALLLLLVRELGRSPAIRAWQSDVGALLASCATFIAVEAFFQFPFEMAFPALLVAVLVGLALAAVERPADAAAGARRQASGPRRRLVDAACLLVAGLMLAGTARLMVAEHLAASRRADRLALERACRLDPRRLDACVEAAWHDSRAGRHDVAQMALAEVLARSPEYPPALKLRAEDLLAAGRRDEGCAQARRYDALFGGASSLHRLVSRECGSGPGRAPS